MGKAVDEILQRIDQLSDEDRCALEEKLTDRFERQWRSDAKEARRIARERGIGQAEIDQAVRELRRGE
jgi:hypothetical protein